MTTGILLKSLSPGRDAILITVSASKMIEDLWQSRHWVNPRVFLKAAQASLACLCVQGLGEEDSVESLEMQWSWNLSSGLSALYADSLFQGAIRCSYVWKGEVSEDLSLGEGTFQLRRSHNFGRLQHSESPENYAAESTGIIPSAGDVSRDVQEILQKSEQKDALFAVSIRWNINECNKDKPSLHITSARAYLLHILPPERESERESIVNGWNRFLAGLASPADWELSPEPEREVQEMTDLIFASSEGKRLFTKNLFFFCHCTQEKAERTLQLLSDEDWPPGFDEKLEVSCKYCGRSYRVGKSKSGLAS